MLNKALIVLCFAGQAVFYGQTPKEMVMGAAANLTQDSVVFRRSFSHHEIEAVEEFKDGIIKKKSKKIFLVFGQGEQLSQTLISKNGVPVDNARPEPKKEFVALNEKLFNRYDYEFEGSEILNGKKYWVISAKPRKNLTEETKIDRLLNNLGMKIWIETEHSDFYRLTAKLLNRVEYAWPGFTGGRAYKIDIEINTAPIYGYTVIKRVRLEYAYSAKAMFWPINGHQIRTICYENYERRNTP